jgi:hypothetical protein
MRKLLAFGNHAKESNQAEDQSALMGEIFAQLLAIFGTVNDSALDVNKLRLEIQDLRQEVKTLNAKIESLSIRSGLKESNGDLPKREVRAVGAFARAPDKGQG